jgi:hypothetical protein
MLLNFKLRAKFWGQILSLWLADIVHYNKLLSSRPASLCSVAWRAGRPPFAIVDYITQSKRLRIWPLVLNCRPLCVDARVPQDVLHVPGVQAAAGQHDVLRLSWGRDILQVMLRQKLRPPRVRPPPSEYWINQRAPWVSSALSFIHCYPFLVSKAVNETIDR